MFLVGTNDVGNVGYGSFDVSGHYFNRSQVVNLRQLEQLRFLFISILFE